jgi:hypothetical protein
MVRRCSAQMSSVAVPFDRSIPCRAEPGFYADEKWGIRIENVVIVRKAETKYNFGDAGYLSFERVTMVCLLLYLRYFDRF